MPDTTPKPGAKPNFAIRHFNIALSFALLAVGPVLQLLILKLILNHPESIGLPGKMALVCALAVIYKAGFFFARNQATATPPTAPPVTRRIPGMIIALCLAYLTVASAEFLKELQRFEILVVLARSEFVITVGRREMKLFFLLVAMALALYAPGAFAATAAPSLRSTIPAQLGTDIAALNQRALLVKNRELLAEQRGLLAEQRGLLAEQRGLIAEQRQRNANMRLQVLNSQSEARN